MTTKSVVKGYPIQFKWIILAILYLVTILEGATIPKIPAADLIFDVGELGKIKGFAKTTSGELKREYVVFMGMPYANAPNGSRRFLPAEEVTTPYPTAPGRDYFDATKTITCCPQGTSVLCSLGYGEDCLQLYVATPLTQAAMDPAKPLPVIMFVHGGTFTSGSYSIYNGDRLLERDVILVSINYRLGVLGFFCLDTEDAPGNAAMYDVVQALTWVKKYIQYFGGDPNKITVTGQSAGSVAVTQLLLSPMTKHENATFQRAIAVSGTALNEWGTTTGQNAKEASLNIAQRVSCYNPSDPDLDDPKEVADCMRLVPSDNLLSALGSYQAEERLAGRLGFSPVTPVVQSSAPVGYEKFLAEEPLTILQEGRQSNVPLMMGSTRHDGSYVLGVVYNEVLNPQGLQHNSTFLKTMAMPMLMAALGIEDTTEGTIYDIISESFLGTYIKNSGNFTLMIPGMIDLHSVFFFKAAELKTLGLHSRLQNKNSFWYSFDFKGTNTLYDMQIGNIPVPGGVSHADDLIYLFNIMTKGKLDLESEKAVSKRLVDNWANFAYSGDPNIGENGFKAPGAQWPSYTEDKPGFFVYNEMQEVIDGYPSDYWKGLSYELMPEIFQPNVTDTITTPSTTSTTSSSTTTTTEGESTTSSATVFSISLLTYSLIMVFVLDYVGHFSGWIAS